MKDKLIKLLTSFIKNNDGIIYKTNYLSLLYVIETLSKVVDEISIQGLYDRLEKDTKRYLSSSLEIEKLYSVIRFGCDETPFSYETLVMDKTYSGLYFIYDEYDNLIYIGKSERNLLYRSLESFFNKQLFGAHKVKLILIDSIDTLSDLENDYIMIAKPLFNQTETKELSNNYSYWIRTLFTLKNELDNEEYLFPVIIKPDDI